MKSRSKVVWVDNKTIIHNINRYDTEEEVEELDKVNAELVLAECANEDEIIKASKDADVIFTQAAQITLRVMMALPKLKAIVRYGVGYETIDVDAATDNGILVINVPDFCHEEVADHTIALLLVCARKLVFFRDWMIQSGRCMSYPYRELSPMLSIGGQTLGLVGCGNIGRTVAKKARCFDLRVLGYDPYVDKSLAKEHGITLVSLPELLKESDFVSVHTFLSKETWHLIGEKEFKQMKSSAYFLNTSRGPVVNEAALIKALQDKWIAGAGLDVFEKEPVDPNNPLLKMDNVVVTPHYAGRSDTSGKRQRIQIGQEAARVLSGRWPKNYVNKTVKPKVSLVKVD